MPMYLCLIPESIPQNLKWLGISTSPSTSAGCIISLKKKKKGKKKWNYNILSWPGHQSMKVLSKHVYLTNHRKKFVGFTTCWRHLVHNTTGSSNNMILHLMTNLDECITSLTKGVSNKISRMWERLLVRTLFSTSNLLAKQSKISWIDG